MTPINPNCRFDSQSLFALRRRLYRQLPACRLRRRPARHTPPYVSTKDTMFPQSQHGESYRRGHRPSVLHFSRERINHFGHAIIFRSLVTKSNSTERLSYTVYRHPSLTHTPILVSWHHQSVKQRKRRVIVVTHLSRENCTKFFGNISWRNVSR